MDIRNLCGKIDVDGIRAKWPELPAMPSNPFSQIKLSKSIPKLKSRKIFRNSRENVISKMAKPDNATLAVPPAPPMAAEFINRTPNRISTISSLMNQNVVDTRGTYCSAYSIDDDYPVAAAHHFERRLSKPISPVKAPPSLFAQSEETQNRSDMSLMQKLQKQCKDISEFRLKHIFAKRVVVRKDTIEVDNYVQSYEEDRLREQQEQAKRDREIAENYGFKFKTSHQLSGHSNSLTSNESSHHARSNRNVRYESDDESGMEHSPVKRDLTTEFESPSRNANSDAMKKKVYRERQLASLDSSREESGPEMGMRKCTDTVEKQGATTKKSNALHSLKHNLLRLQKSANERQSSDNEADTEKADVKVGRVSRTEQFTARLRKFKSQDNVENIPQAVEADSLPPVQVITTKLKTWKKSFKRQLSESADQARSDTSPENAKNSSGFLKKFKDMRKSHSNCDDLSQSNHEESGNKKGNALEFRFTEVRNKTFKKIQQINLFHKSQENIANDLKKKDSNKNLANSPKSIHSSLDRSQSEERDEYECEEEEHDIYRQNIKMGNPKTVWSTKPIHCDSMDSDSDTELPRVLIHQDHSDAFDSTLIIAVTRSAITSPLISPTIEDITDTELQITEIPAEDRNSKRKDATKSCMEWIPNRDIITNYLNAAPLPRRRGSTPQCNQTIYRERMTANPSDDDEGPWRVGATRHESLYKARSIDIFQKNLNVGGVAAVFDDFENELQDEPIVSIADNSSQKNSEGQSSTDNDTSKSQTNSSPVKSPKQQFYANRIPKIGNSRESLIAHLNGCGEEDSEEDRPPSTAPSPPPHVPMESPDNERPLKQELMSPPMSSAATILNQLPPKIPERNSSNISTAPNIVAPPLPTSKPPALLSKPPALRCNAPPRIIERTASMSRTAKPLVKTSSLRLTFDEVKPADVGKVNKLITRFEKPKQRPKIVPRFKRYESAEENSDIEEVGEQPRQNNDENISIKTSNTLNGNTPKTDNNVRMARVSLAKTKHVRRREIVNATQIEDAKIVTETVSINIIQTQDEGNEENQKLPISVVPKISLLSDRNANYSCASSEYGSPPEYPSSLIGSTQVTPVPNRRQNQDTLTLRRSRRSMTREDDNFFSFDSDEENSYYSISSTGSSRYVVEI